MLDAATAAEVQLLVGLLVLVMSVEAAAVHWVVERMEKGCAHCEHCRERNRLAEEARKAGLDARRAAEEAHDRGMEERLFGNRHVVRDEEGEEPPPEGASGDADGDAGRPREDG